MARKLKVWERSSSSLDGAGIAVEDLDGRFEDLAIQGRAAIGADQPRGDVPEPPRVVQLARDDAFHLVAFAQQRGDALVLPFEQFAGIGGGREGRPALLVQVLRVELRADELGEQLQRLMQHGIVELGRLRVDGAERAEERIVGAEDRDRDIALEAVHPGRRVLAEAVVRAGAAEDDGASVLPDLVADRRDELEFVPGLEREGDLVAYGARRPGGVGHAGDGGETHPGETRHGVEDGRHDGHAADRVDVLLFRAHRRMLAPSPDSLASRAAGVSTEKADGDGSSRVGHRGLRIAG